MTPVATTLSTEDKPQTPQKKRVRVRRKTTSNTENMNTNLATGSVSTGTVLNK